jgi:hypothetical protein
MHASENNDVNVKRVIAEDDGAYDSVRRISGIFCISTILKQQLSR